MDDPRITDFFAARNPPHPRILLSDMPITELESFPADANPFHHDAYHMGTYLPDLAGHRNWAAMYEEKGKYLILVHIPTGKRIRIDEPLS